MRQAILSIAILAVSLSRLLAAEMPVQIRHSAPMKGGQGLGTKSYVPLEDEEPFLKKVTEKEIDLWADIQMPKPSNVSEADWEMMEKDRIDEEKKMIPVGSYELHKQPGEYVGWFGIVRSITFDEETGASRLLVEHKYFDGLTDLHLHIVSLYGAGDFQVVLPGRVTPEQIPRLGLICAYGPVAAVAAMAIVKAEYVRVWDWGLFTFMDYGQDKSNAKWVKLRKVDEDEVYSPRPSLNFYIQRLGPREEIEQSAGANGQKPVAQP